MRLYFDEDVGKGIPNALRGVGVGDVVYPGKYNRGRGKTQLRVERGFKDWQWIPVVGIDGYLAISYNHHMLDVDIERQLLIQNMDGMVYIMCGREISLNVLRLILQKWEWLEALYETEPRPFAYKLRMSGHARRDPRV